MLKLISADSELSTISKIHYRLYHQCNKKKKHEILPSVQVVDTIIKKTNATHVIDIGSGVGYLSFAIAATLEIPVLGLELNESNCRAAEKRKETISSFLDKEGAPKAIRGLFTSIPYTVNSEQDSAAFRGDIMDMITSHYPLRSQDYRILLIGLHTCGDLASSTLRFFCDIPEICAVYNLGCCYNKITVPHDTVSNRTDSSQSQENCSKISNFPLSQSVTDLCNNANLTLNRRLMLLGCQSILRDNQEPSKTEQSMRILSYRAHIEVLLLLTTTKA